MSTLFLTFLHFFSFSTFSAHSPKVEQSGPGQRYMDRLIDCQLKCFYSAWDTFLTVLRYHLRALELFGHFIWFLFFAFRCCCCCCCSCTSACTCRPSRPPPHPAPSHTLSAFSTRVERKKLCIHTPIALYLSYACVCICVCLFVYPRVLCTAKGKEQWRRQVSGRGGRAEGQAKRQTLLGRTGRLKRLPEPACRSQNGVWQSGGEPVTSPLSQPPTHPPVRPCSASLWLFDNFSLILWLRRRRECKWYDRQRRGPSDSAPPPFTRFATAHPCASLSLSLALFLSLCVY